MKFILIILSLLISGCANKHTLNINNIQTITYNSMNLVENDFNLVLNEINKLEFKEEKVSENVSNTLRIVSDEKIYNFKLHSNIISYEHDNKTYVANNVNNLKYILKQLENEYTDFSFFYVLYDKCKPNDNGLVIKVDNTSNCMNLNTDKIIYNFRINSIETTEDHYIEDNLLYQSEEIKSNSIMIKVDILNEPKFKISFDTEHNYTISMLPIYNNVDKKIDFNISHEQKNRP